MRESRRAGSRIRLGFGALSLTVGLVALVAPELSDSVLALPPGSDAEVLIKIGQLATQPFASVVAAAVLIAVGLLILRRDRVELSCTSASIGSRPAETGVTDDVL